MRPTFKHLSLIGLIMTAWLITGCVSPPPIKDGTPEAMLNWRIDGKLGIRTPDKAHSAQLIWKHNAPDYFIQLSGPLGQGKVTIERSNNIVTVKDKNTSRTASSAESLLYELSGLTMPVHLLEYWVRGITAPRKLKGSSKAVAITRNEEKRITHFAQAGWHINYLRFNQAGALTLPSKIKLNNNDYRLTIIVKNWSGAETPE